MMITVHVQIGLQPPQEVIIADLPVHFDQEQLEKRVGEIADRTRRKLLAMTHNPRRRRRG